MLTLIIRHLIRSGVNLIWKNQTAIQVDRFFRFYANDISIYFKRVKQLLTKIIDSYSSWLLYERGGQLKSSTLIQFWAEDRARED